MNHVNITSAELYSETAISVFLILLGVFCNGIVASAFILDRRCHNLHTCLVIFFIAINNILYTCFLNCIFIVSNFVDVGEFGQNLLFYGENSGAISTNFLLLVLVLVRYVSTKKGVIALHAIEIRYYYVVCALCMIIPGLTFTICVIFLTREEMINGQCSSQEFDVEIYGLDGLTTLLLLLAILIQYKIFKISNKSSMKLRHTGLRVTTISGNTFESGKEDSSWVRRRRLSNRKRSGMMKQRLFDLILPGLICLLPSIVLHVVLDFGMASLVLVPPAFCRVSLLLYFSYLTWPILLHVHNHKDFQRAFRAMRQCQRPGARFDYRLREYSASDKFHTGKWKCKYFFYFSIRT